MEYSSVRLAEPKGAALPHTLRHRTVFPIAVATHSPPAVKPEASWNAGMMGDQATLPISRGELYARMGSLRTFRFFESPGRDADDLFRGEKFLGCKSQINTCPSSPANSQSWRLRGRRNRTSCSQHCVCLAPCDAVHLLSMCS